MLTDCRLIIMRHAKSDWNTDAANDFDRPLAARGKRDGVRMGKWLLEQQFTPDRIISSPARRARQTTNLIAKELDIPEAEVIWAERIYAASLAALIEVVDTSSADISCLLLVGHNPGVDELLCYLASEQPVPDARGRLLTTAAVAILNFGRKSITANPDSAALEYLIRPKELNV